MQGVIAAIVLATAFSFLPLPASADWQGNMMGSGSSCGGSAGEGEMGMMGDMSGCGPGVMDEQGGMMGLGPLRMLNLNPDQRSRLNKIQFDLKKQIWALKGKTFDHQAALRDLYAADRLDPKKIGSAYTSIFDIRRQMIEAQIDARNRGRDLLTKEQVEQLQQLQQQDHAGMCGMHQEMHQHKMSE